MKEFLTRKETAELLGVHPATLRRWVVEGKLACYKSSTAYSGRVKFKLTDIMKFIERQKIDNKIKGE